MRAREPASFWPGKRDSRSHSTKSLSENVIVAEIIYGYRMLEVLSFWDTGSGLKVSVKENEVPTEKNSSRASIFATKASYISN